MTNNQSTQLFMRDFAHTDTRSISWLLQQGTRLLGRTWRPA